MTETQIEAYEAELRERYEDACKTASRSIKKAGAEFESAIYQPDTFDDAMTTLRDAMAKAEIARSRLATACEVQFEASSEDESDVVQMTAKQPKCKDGTWRGHDWQDIGESIDEETGRTVGRDKCDKCDCLRVSTIDPQHGWTRYEYQYAGNRTAA